MSWPAPRASSPATSSLCVSSQQAGLPQFPLADGEEAQLRPKNVNITWENFVSNSTEIYSFSTHPRNGTWPSPSNASAAHPPAAAPSTVPAT